MMYEQPSNAAPGLNDYIDAVQRRKMLVAATTIVTLALAALFLSNRVDTFEAESRVLVGNSRSLSINETQLQRPNLEREREVMLSDAVIDGAATDLGLTFEETRGLVDEVDVQFRPDSDVLTVSKIGPDAALTASVVNAVAASYTLLREEAETTFFSTRVEALEEAIDALEIEFAALETELESLAAERAAALTSGLDAQVTSAQLSTIDSAVNTLRTSRSQVSVDLRAPRASLLTLRSQQSTRPVSAELLSPALIPQNPTGISSTIVYGAAGLVGLAMGVVLAFALARLDRKAKSREDVEFALGSPVLAGVPSFGWRGIEMVMLESAPTGRNARTAESIRRLRASVNFLAGTHGHQAFVFTSSFPAEGKTTVCANLGVAFAKAGRRTVVVSADLRRPSLETRFNISATAGLSDWLSGAEIDLLVETGTPDLYIVPAGRRAANSAELLGLDRFTSLIDELKRNFEIVLIDSPPVLSTADALTLAAQADGVVVVVDGKQTEVDNIQEVRSQLERSGATILGAVLNRERSEGGFWWSKDKYNYDSKPE